MLGVIAQRLDRIHILLLALMDSIPGEALAGVTLSAKKVFTEAALVASGDASAAIITGTGHKEIGPRRLGLGPGLEGLILTIQIPIESLRLIETMTKTIHLDPHMTHLLLDLMNLPLGGLFALLILGRLLEIAHMGLGLGKERILLMVPILLVHKGPAEGRAQKLHVPLGGTEHALGHHDRILKEIGLDALVAGRLLARGTGHAAMGGPIERFHTDGAVHRHLCDGHIQNTNPLEVALFLFSWKILA